MKLFEEFKEYETLWDDLQPKVAKSQVTRARAHAKKLTQAAAYFHNAQKVATYKGYDIYQYTDVDAKPRANGTYDSRTRYYAELDGSRMGSYHSVQDCKKLIDSYIVQCEFERAHEQAAKKVGTVAMQYRGFSLIYASVVDPNSKPPKYTYQVLTTTKSKYVGSQLDYKKFKDLATAKRAIDECIKQYNIDAPYYDLQLYRQSKSTCDNVKVGKTITEDWYGADSEVEFETSVYPDIAKYFGLKDNEVVTYAYYYTDEVIVNYDDAAGRSHEIEEHVPLDQVEEWFKAGYTILNEANGDICTVYFKHDPSTAIFTGSKQDCDQFVKNNILNAATQARGGLIVKKGGSVHVAKKLEQDDASLKDCYVVLTGDSPDSCFVHGVFATQPQARSALNKVMKEFSGNIELAQLFDLTESEAASLASMVGKEVTGADADFISDFFTDGSRVDSLYNNFFESATTKKTSRKQKNLLKEAVPSTASSIISRYNNNVADHILELQHEKEFNDAEWFEDNWYVLENVEVHPNYYKLIVDRPIESDIDAEAIISYAFEPATIVGMDDAMSEGGVVYDEGDNWIYVERWVVTGLAESKSSTDDHYGNRSWQDLLAEADKLLDEICDQSGNSAWDDSDSYWQGDAEWKNRHIFYGRLANLEKLEELCDRYSIQLDNIEFYFFDDEDDEISEIGYIATRFDE